MIDKSHKFTTWPRIKQTQTISSYPNRHPVANMQHRYLTWYPTNNWHLATRFLRRLYHHVILAWWNGYRFIWVLFPLRRLWCMPYTENLMHDDVIKRNIFRVTGILCGEFTGHRWIPRTKASDGKLWCFLWSAGEPTVGQTMETPMIWNAIALILTSF